MVKNKIALIAIALVAIVGLVVSGCAAPPAPAPASPAPAPAPKVYKWKFQVLWDPATMPYHIEEEFVERVKELSGGRLVLEMYPPGGLVPTMEMLDAVSKGVFELMKTYDGYYMGKEPALAFTGSVAAGFPEAWDYETWFWELGGIKLAREAYKRFNCYYIAPTVYGYEPQHSKVPIRTLADYKGKKARFVGMALKVAEKLGMSVTPMKTADVYPALEKGVIDLADRGGLKANWDAGIQEVTKYIILPGWHQPATATSYVANLDAWNKLPADLKAILEAAGRESSMKLFTRHRVESVRALKDFIDYGIEVIYLPKEDVMKIREIAKEVWAGYAAKSPLAKKVYDSQMEYMKLLGLIK